MRNDRPDYHCSSVIEETHLTNKKTVQVSNSNIGSNCFFTKKYSKKIAQT